MFEYIYLGATPADEECAQVGTDSYSTQATAECKAWINQLWRHLKVKHNITLETSPESFSLIKKSDPHDFGSYYEVCVRVDPNNEDAIELAFFLEGDAPHHWDEEALLELGRSNENI